MLIFAFSDLYSTKFKRLLSNLVHGVKSVDDKRFEKTFENVYIDDYLINTPWFHQLGNHDYYGNVEAQLEYMSESKRW